MKHWLLAIRPKTLSMAFVPVVTGTAIAWSQQGGIHIFPMLVALIAALMIQIGTNLHNDAVDYERGVDTHERLGPKRAVAQGWLSAHEVRRGALISFIIALLCGVYLIWLAGWPILLIGLLSLAAGFGYSGGPRPIAYTPLGELFVLLFFGVVAVAGSYYLQVFSMSTSALLGGIIIGLPASAVLLINNYRDLETDVEAGRTTLVSFIGRNSARYLYAALLVLPLILAPLLTNQPLRMLTWLVLPMAIYLVRTLRRSLQGIEFNQLLVQTAQYQLLFSVLLITSLVYPVLKMP